MQEWKNNYLFLLTDDTGILQHGKYSLPDPRHGYTTDDNARALILAILLIKNYPGENYEKILYRYASFLLNAQNDRGKFKNFMSYGRDWLEEEGSDDCQGRCIWAIGTLVAADHVPSDLKLALYTMLDKALLTIESLEFLRAKAYALIGLSLVESDAAKEAVVRLGETLLCSYRECSDSDWHWFENVLAYSNSILPWAMFAAYRVTKKSEFLVVAEESLDFLIRQTFSKEYFEPIGCQGWLKKGGVAAVFDQQPIEACETLLMLKEAFRITKKSSYKKRAHQCFGWYEGENREHCFLIDEVTGGCFDGITKNGVNRNMGAESQISYGIAYFTMLDADAFNV